MAFTFLCGDALFQASVEQRLALANDQTQARAWFVLLDRPLGWASLDHATVDFSKCIILSDNACPSYQLDLIEREPAALLPLDKVDSLGPILDSLSAGHTLYPKVTTPLSPTERRTVRLVAFGLSNKAIASRRKVTERTVKNTLYACYEKLNLRTRVQVAHYYLGNWHLIQGWQVPSHIKQGAVA